MTATAHRRQLSSTSHAEPPVPRRQALRVFLLCVAFAACEAAGMTALVLSYTIAQTTLTSSSEFAWFWAGMFLLELPLAGLLARRATPRAMRTGLLIFYGLVSYAPKLLRNPVSPLYHDEFAHWRETHEILTTGKLFQPNPIISIISRYPGLHAATAALVQATGLNIWQAGTLLLILFHVTLVLGVATLAHSLGMSSRTASIAAILYGLNSSFLYFDTQYGYESMAITLVVWALVAYVRAIRSQRGQGRAAWGGLTVVLAAGTVVTHHLSTFTLVLIMALIALTVSLPWLARGESPVDEAVTPTGWPVGWAQERRAPGGRREKVARVGMARTALTAWGLTLVTALMMGAWFRFVAPTTWSYLSPFLGQGLSQLMQFVKGTGGARQLFGASLSPWWEQKSAYLVPLLALCFALGGLFLIRARVRDGILPRGGRRALLLGLSLLGLVYFPSTIFILAPSGAEGARRSWAFSWIGLSILAAPAVVWLLDWSGRRGSQWLRFSLRSGLLAALAIAIMGGTAAGLDASYRFPGPFLYGSDTRSITPELLAASKWFSTRFGPGHNIVTDRYTGLVFGSFGLQNPASPSAGFPVYNLYSAKSPATIGPADLLFDLSLSDYTYLVVDNRMANDLPELGLYFTPNDPESAQPHGGKSPFHGKLNKFDTIKWMIKVFQSANYSIYRLSLPARSLVTSCDRQCCAVGCCRGSCW